MGAGAPVGGRHRARRAGLPGGGDRRLPGRRRRGMIRVAVAGAAGRMGQMVCAAVDAADDLSLSGRADPVLDVTVSDVLADADVLVDCTRPDTALDNARAALDAGVHVVIGTSGFDLDGLREAARGSSAKAFFAPNFAIGAVLMMKFAAEASRHMERAEIVELHARRPVGGPPGGGPAGVADRRARASAVRVTIAVTDHAVERYLQRVRGVLDARPEIAGRVRRAFDAGRVEEGGRGGLDVPDV